MDMLLLTTTAQHSTVNEKVILDPKLLKKWIDDLPERDISATVSHLNQAIDNFNQINIEPKQRLKLLKIYYDALQDVLISYDEIRLTSTHMSSQLKAKLREDIMWLFLALANGYKLIVKTAFDGGKSPMRDQDLCFAVYVAMELIIEGLLYAYRSHLSLPPLARLEINQMYLYALDSGVVDIPIKAIKGHSRIPTINILFKQHILMCITDPYHLNSMDILEMFMFLESVVDDCEIELSGKTTPYEGRYLINMQHDDVPVPCHLFPDLEYADNQSIVVDVWPIVNTLAKRLAMHNDSDQSFAAINEKHMIDIIIKKFGQTNQRKDLRTKVNKPAKVCFGMQHVHKLLVCRQDNKSAASTSDTMNHLFGPQNYLTINKNNGGYLMSGMISDANEGINVGDIIAILHGEHAAPETRQELAIIRWLRREQDAKLKFGVELIPGEAIPMQYRVEPDDETESEDNNHLGLYIHNSERGTTAALIRKDLFNKAKKLHSLRDGIYTDMHTVALLLESPLYILMQIKY